MTFFLAATFDFDFNGAVFPDCARLAFDGIESSSDDKYVKHLKPEILIISPLTSGHSTMNDRFRSSIFRENLKIARPSFLGQGGLSNSEAPLPLRQSDIATGERRANWATSLRPKRASEIGMLSDWARTKPENVGVLNNLPSTHILAWMG